MFIFGLSNFERFAGQILDEERYTVLISSYQSPDDLDSSKSEDKTLRNEENEEEVEFLEKRVCKLDRDQQDDVGLKIEPKYKMDPAKFLAVAGSRGPNNQIVSLRDTIFFAIALNRTLIIPPFFKHDRGDPTSNHSNTEIVDFYQRVDLKRIKELISVVEPENALGKCGKNGFDILYRLQQICQRDNYNRIQAMRDFYNFPKTEKTIDYAAKCEDKTINSVDIIPPRDFYTFRSNILLIRDKVDPLQKVRDLYTSEHKCPLATYPYNSSPILKAWKSGDRIEGQVSRDIITNTRRPAHLEAFVDSFIKRFSPSKKYISIHWRYDTSDWKNEQCKSPKFKLVCENFEILQNATKLSNFLMKFFEETGAEKNYDFVYIATPPNELPLIKAVQQELKEESKMKIITQIELSKALADNYGDCGNKYEDLRFEILSLAEMEVCVTSSTFFYSFGSSWSFNVQAERDVMNKGLTILNTKILEKNL